MRLSFVIPTYNSPFFLARCLASIVTQDSVPDEIIVSDDSSNTSVRDLVAAWSVIYSQISYVNGPRSGNPVDNWNEGMNHATGSHICLIHHDEWLARKDYISSVKVEISKAAKGACIFTESVVVGGLRRSRYHTVAKMAAMMGNPLWSLYGANWIGPTAAFVLPSSTGVRFDRNLRSLVDVDFYVRAVGPSRLIRLPGAFVCSGAHEDQISAAIDGSLVGLLEIDQIMARESGAASMRLEMAKAVLRLRALLAMARPITPRRQAH